MTFNKHGSMEHLRRTIEGLVGDNGYRALATMIVHTHFLEMMAENASTKEAEGQAICMPASAWIEAYSLMTDEGVAAVKVIERVLRDLQCRVGHAGDEEEED